jgi:hypothetical protein
MLALVNNELVTDRSEELFKKIPSSFILAGDFLLVCVSLLW